MSSPEPFTRWMVPPASVVYIHSPSVAPRFLSFNFSFLKSTYYPQQLLDCPHSFPSYHISTVVGLNFPVLAERLTGQNGWGGFGGDGRDWGSFVRAFSFHLSQSKVLGSMDFSRFSTKVNPKPRVYPGTERRPTLTTSHSCS